MVEPSGGFKLHQAERAFKPGEKHALTECMEKREPKPRGLRDLAPRDVLRNPTGPGITASLCPAGESFYRSTELAASSGQVLYRSYRPFSSPRSLPLVRTIEQSDSSSSFQMPGFPLSPLCPLRSRLNKWSFFHACTLSELRR